MKTFFYNRTVYSLGLLNMEVPQCFLELDDHFDTLFTTSPGLTHESVRLAENLCRRIADIEFHAHFISEKQKSPDTFKAAILIGTYLVGYFNACKSLLDACAITLAKVYNLRLKNKQMDFSKSIFWKQLESQTGSVIKNRYKPFAGLFDEIIEWRDAAVHRITPFVITHSPGAPDKTPREQMEIKMVAQADADISTVVKRTRSIQWVEPLYYHKKWRSQLLELCKEVCLDIRSQTFRGT